MTDKDMSLADQLAQRERAYQALRQRTDRYRQEARRYRRLYRNAPVGMVAIDLVSGRSVSVNRSMLTLTGYRRREFLDLDPAGFLTEESRRRFGEHCTKLAVGEDVAASLELQIAPKGVDSAQTRPTVGFLHKDDRRMVAVAAFYPLDELQEASSTLVEREECFRKLVDAMNDGLVILDQEGRVTHVNKHFEQISGYRSDELEGQAIHAFLSPEASRLIKHRLSAKDLDQPRTFEITWQRKSGERQYSLVTPQFLETTALGARYASFAVITDITPKKRAQTAIRQRERELREKNQRLEEMNTALQTLVEMREQDKADIKHAVATHLKRLVNPLVEKLRRSGMNERQKLFIDLLSSNLEELASSCETGFASQMLVLTPSETEVANFIRHGRTTKEIASLMNISIRTVEMHRLNIRRKLGLHRTKTNLRSYLLSS